MDMKCSRKICRLLGVNIFMTYIFEMVPQAALCRKRFPTPRHRTVEQFGGVMIASVSFQDPHSHEELAALITRKLPVFLVSAFVKGHRLLLETAVVTLGASQNRAVWVVFCFYVEVEHDSSLASIGTVRTRKLWLCVSRHVGFRMLF